MSILGKGNQVVDQLDGSIRIVDRQVGTRVYFEDGGRLGIALCGRVFPKGVKVVRTPQEQALWADIPNQHAAANKVNFDVWKVIGGLVDEIESRNARIAELEDGAPSFAFATGDPDPLKLAATDRRFMAKSSTRETSLAARVKYLEGVLRQIQAATLGDVMCAPAVHDKCQDALYNEAL